MTTLDISRFFAPSSKSPEGKVWAQNLFLNPVAGEANKFKGNGKTDNDNDYLAGVDLNIKTSEKTGKQYANGYLKVDGVMLGLSLFPASVEAFPSLKFHGVVQQTEGEGEARVQTKLADLDLIEFTSKAGVVAYQLRLKPVYNPTGATASVAKAEQELAIAGMDDEIPF